MDRPLVGDMELRLEAWRPAHQIRVRAHTRNSLGAKTGWPKQVSTYSKTMKSFEMPISKAKGLHPEYKNAPPGKKVWLVLRELTRKITVYQKAQNKWKLKIEKLIRFAKCVGMKQSLKTTTRCIGMRAGKFLGVRRILPEFSQTCSKRFCATFAYIFFPRRP